MKSYHKNPRTISAKQFGDLNEWLAEFGDLSGIVHDINSDEIIGGNQRSRVFGIEGQGISELMTQGQVVITETFDPPTATGTVSLGYIIWQGERYTYRQVVWDADKCERANIIANKAGGVWDFDVLANQFDFDLLTASGFDARELTGLDFGDPPEEAPEPDLDRAQELLAKWQVERGQVWQIGDHRLMCGDSTHSHDVEVLMGGERISLVWTDPPYGVNYGEKLNGANPISHRVRTIENDNLPADELEIFIREALKCAAEKSVKGAAVYVACPPGTLLPTLIASFVGSGFDFRWGLVWVKDQLVLGRGDYHFKHENILYGWKPDGAHYFTEDRTQTSVFEIPRPKRSEEHPTMKPVELIEQMVENSSRRNEVVYDAFCGSGSTLIACERRKRKGYGMEISPAYCAVILERMLQMGLAPVLLP